jgi:hypothetical protein
MVSASLKGMKAHITDANRFYSKQRNTSNSSDTQDAWMLDLPVRLSVAAPFLSDARPLIPRLLLSIIGKSKNLLITICMLFCSSPSAVGAFKKAALFASK